LPLALETTVKVQLLNDDNGNCWEADFSEATANDETSFSARSD
jgi:hypothetical protein